jgi:hypothetical protein
VLKWAFEYKGESKIQEMVLNFKEALYDKLRGTEMGCRQSVRLYVCLKVKLLQWFEHIKRMNLE